MSTKPATGSSAPAEHSNAYLYWIVFVLTAASTLSLIDRQILNVMIGPVKRDLGGLSDTEVSLIMGLAFAFFYNIMSYPAGRLADAYSRRNLMAAGVASWSLMTVLCGAAGTYWQLFLARMGVGVGEATLGPAANSTLADYFDKSRLPLAIAIVAAAPFIGQGLANMLGGPLIDYLENTPNISVPLIGELFSWQVVFIVVGLPGILVTIWVLTIKEPARKGRSAEGAGNIPFSEVWAFVKTRGMFFFLIFAAYLCLSIQGWSLFSWLVEYFVRNHEWTRSDIGVRYGAIAMFVGISGSVWAGWMGSRLIRKGTLDASVRIVFFGTILLVPLATTLTILPNPWMALGFLVPVTFLMAMPSGLIMTTIQLISPNELRGQMIAFYLIAVNFIAYSVAPSLPAVLGDFLFESELALGKSISLLAVINYSIAALCLGLCLKYFRRALKAAEAWD